MPGHSFVKKGEGLEKGYEQILTYPDFPVDLSSLSHRYVFDSFKTYFLGPMVEFQFILNTPVGFVDNSMSLVFNSIEKDQVCKVAYNIVQSNNKTLKVVIKASLYCFDMVRRRFVLRFVKELARATTQFLNQMIAAKIVLRHKTGRFLGPAEELLTKFLN